MTKLSYSYLKYVSRIVDANTTDPIMLELSKYIRLLVLMVQRFPNSDCHLDDILSEAVVGYLEAKRDYDPKRSADFKGYLSYKALGRIYEYSLANNHVPHMPMGKAKVLSLVNRMYIAIEKKQPSLIPLSREIIECEKIPSGLEMSGPLREGLLKLKTTVTKIASNGKTTYSNLVEIAHMVRDFTYSSLDDIKFPQEALGYIDIEGIDFRTDLETHLKKLTPQKREIFSLALQGHNNQQIGDRLDPPITRQAVREHILTIIAKLKREVEIDRRSP